MVLTRFGLSETEFGSLITSHEACRCLVAYKGGGGVWGLGRFWAIWGEKSPEQKSFQMCFGILWGVVMMFPDGFDVFWAL